MKTNPVSRFFLSVIIVTSLITTQSCSKKTDPPDPQIIKPELIRTYENLYDSPAEEFGLSRITLEKGAAYRNENEHNAEIVIVIEGSGKITIVAKRELSSTTRRFRSMPLQT